MKQSSVVVKCYSGHSYAQRPTVVQAGGREYIVAHITAEGRTPEGKWFQILTECGRSLRLMVDASNEHWSVSGLDEGQFIFTQ